jgi:hypothetical protein
MMKCMGNENNPLIRLFLILRDTGEGTAANCKKEFQQSFYKKMSVGLKEIFNMKLRVSLVRFPGRRMAGSQNGRLSWPCGMGENFGFRGPIG